MKTIFRDSEEQLIRNIKLAKAELLASSTMEQANLIKLKEIIYTLFLIYNNMF